jgi:hypothetical protein
VSSTRRCARSARLTPLKFPIRRTDHPSRSRCSLRWYPHPGLRPHFDQGGVQAHPVHFHVQTHTAFRTLGGVVFLLRVGARMTPLTDNVLIERQGHVVHLSRNLLFGPRQSLIIVDIPFLLHVGVPLISCVWPLTETVLDVSGSDSSSTSSLSVNAAALRLASSRSSCSTSECTSGPSSCRSALAPIHPVVSTGTRACTRRPSCHTSLSRRPDRCLSHTCTGSSVLSLQMRSVSGTVVRQLTKWLALTIGIAT